LEPGQEIFIPYPTLAGGERDAAGTRNMAPTISKYAKRAGWRIVIRPDIRGLYILRQGEQQQVI